MRKDVIEERIVQIEKDIRTLNTEHREGVENILTEMRTFQNFIIEEKIDSVHKQLVKDYEKMLIELMLQYAEHNLDKRCQDPCIKNKRKGCLQFLLSKLRDGAIVPDDLKGMTDSDPVVVQNDDFLSKYPSFSEPPCNDCYDKYLDEKDQLSRSLKNYADYKQTNLVKTNGLFLSELPIEATIASIIEPLSHESRFEMLKALSTGSMTFKELSELTNSKGGHLIYHITKLVDAGLVIKIDAGKRYSITDRGLSMMVFIKQLCSQ